MTYQTNLEICLVFQLVSYLLAICEQRLSTPRLNYQPSLTLLGLVHGDEGVS